MNIRTYHICELWRGKGWIFVILSEGEMEETRTNLSLVYTPFVVWMAEELPILMYN